MLSGELNLPDCISPSMVTDHLAILRLHASSATTLSDIFHVERTCHRIINLILSARPTGEAAFAELFAGPLGAVLWHISNN